MGSRQTANQGDKMSRETRDEIEKMHSALGHDMDRMRAVDALGEAFVGDLELDTPYITVDNPFFPEEKRGVKYTSIALIAGYRVTMTYDFPDKYMDDMPENAIHAPLEMAKKTFRIDL